MLLRGWHKVLFGVCLWLPWVFGQSLGKWEILTHSQHLAIKAFVRILGFFLFSNSRCKYLYWLFLDSLFPFSATFTIPWESDGLLCLNHQSLRKQSSCWKVTDFIKSILFWSSWVENMCACFEESLRLMSTRTPSLLLPRLPRRITCRMKGLRSAY